MEIKPFYFSEIHKQYEIEYLESNNYKFIKDLSYIKNNYESRILLFEYDNKNILRGYKDGIIFPKITYFDIENIHIKKKEKKLKEVFDYIYNIFSEYNIINTKIHQEMIFFLKVQQLAMGSSQNRKYENHWNYIYNNILLRKQFSEGYIIDKKEIIKLFHASIEKEKEQIKLVMTTIPGAYVKGSTSINEIKVLEIIDRGLNEAI